MNNKLSQGKTLEYRYTVHDKDTNVVTVTYKRSMYVFLNVVAEIYGS